MSIIAAALKHMLASGMPHEAIVAAVEDMEVELASHVKSKPRSKAAERQARYAERKRQKTSENVRNDADLTKDDVLTSEMTLSDAAELPLSPPPPSFPQTPNQPPPPHTPTRVTRTRGAQAKPTEKFKLPDWIPIDEWESFERMRVKIRKPMTDDARRLAVKRLTKLNDDGWPPGEVLNHCTMNSYQGIFPPKDDMNGTGNRSTNGYSSGSAGQSRTAVAARRSMDSVARFWPDPSDADGRCEGGAGEYRGEAGIGDPQAVLRPDDPLPGSLRRIGNG